MRRLVLLVVILIIILVVWNAASERFSGLLGNRIDPLSKRTDGTVKLITEESVVIDVVKNVGPSVVTVAARDTRANIFDENDPFSIFGFPTQRERSTEPQNIGSGFIISDEGLIVTNKHVVSESGVSYQILTSDDKRYDVQRIYRDPLNDIAILKINPDQNRGTKLPVVELGDSGNLQVGQMAIAIGTPLGEFNNSVTRGIISGLGRGIVAGSSLEGYVEQLDNVIQTDAAISPGNSGGPLLNSSGQVIGVNSAVSIGAENIGFALPINLIKDSLKNFNETGQFNRPYLGIAYRMISRDLAIQNDIPEGAYVQTVVAGSAAEKAGIQEGDIITKFDGQNVRATSAEIASLISKKKVGDTITLTVSREEENGDIRTLELKATLEAAPEQ